jgi:hypothetical protein
MSSARARERQVLRNLFVAAAACVLLAGGVAIRAEARCVCRCVDGEVVPVCENANDVPPICSPAVCPVDSPRVKPTPAPRGPRTGTGQCETRRVFNPTTGEYELKEVCP